MSYPVSVAEQGYLITQLNLLSTQPSPHADAINDV